MKEEVLGGEGLHLKERGEVHLERSLQMRNA
jgi:hypothetical protein